LCAQYAEIERKRSGAEGKEAVREIYERGAKAVGHSVDMWVKYLLALQDMEFPVEVIRSVFGRAVEMCGSDPRKDNELWKNYIQFELSLGEFSIVAKLYKRALSEPVRQLDDCWSRFVQFSADQPASVLASAEEVTDFSAEIPDSTEDRETAVKARVIASYGEVKQHAAAELQKRSAFEAAIGRTYFHVKPLKDAELANWRSYLTYEEALGDTAKVTTLYERCLVACANYSEFWMRFADYKFSAISAEAACEVCERSTKVFLKLRPDVHLHYACTAEACGTPAGLDTARAVYKNILNSVAPNLVEAQLKFSNFERRQQNMEAAVGVLEAATSSAPESTRPFLYMQLARLHQLIKSDTGAVRSVFEEGLKVLPSSLELWLALINFEGTVGARDKVVAAYESAIVGTLSFQDKECIWTHYLEHTEDHAPTIRELLDLTARHNSWRGTTNTSKKRPADGDGGQANPKRAAAAAAAPADPAPAAPPADAPSSAAAAQQLLEHVYQLGPSLAAGLPPRCRCRQPPRHRKSCCPLIAPALVPLLSCSVPLPTPPPCMQVARAKHHCQHHFEVILSEATL
jgi:pre-mRNA-processing factor 39